MKRLGFLVVSGSCWCAASWRASRPQARLGTNPARRHRLLELRVNAQPVVCLLGDRMSRAAPCSPLWNGSQTAVPIRALRLWFSWLFAFVFNIFLIKISRQFILIASVWYFPPGDRRNFPWCPLWICYAVLAWLLLPSISLASIDHCRHQYHVRGKALSRYWDFLILDLPLTSCLVWNVSLILP